MSAGVHPLKTAGLTGCVGGSMAALAYVNTGLVAVVPAATGLAAFAASDLRTRRFSLRALRLVSVLVGLALVTDAARAGAWDRLAVAVVLTALIGAAMLGVWLGTSGLAFGDVLLTTFAVVVPAWVSPFAVGVTVLVAILGALATVVVRRTRPGSPFGGVALAPALLAGWVVAVVIV